LLVERGDALRDADEVLNVVAELMSDDIRLPERANARVLGERLKEAQIQVDGSVGAAVERSGAAPRSRNALRLRTAPTAPGCTGLPPG
jgi:hypothetical protein